MSRILVYQERKILFFRVISINGDLGCLSLSYTEIFSRNVYVLCVCVVNGLISAYWFLTHRIANSVVGKDSFKERSFQVIISLSLAFE